MESKKIVIQFFKENKNIKTIQCLKVFSKEQAQKIREKASLIKDGAILIPAKFVKKLNENSMLISKSGRVVKSKDKALYAIESSKNTLDELRCCDKIKIFESESVKEEKQQTCACIQEVVEPQTDKNDEEIVDAFVNRKINERALPVQVQVAVTETLSQRKEKVVEEELILAEVKEETVKKQPVQETVVTKQEDELDKTLASVLESIQRKAESKEEKRKEDTENEKLKLELTRKKLELISLWISANKQEQ